MIKKEIKEFIKNRKVDKNGIIAAICLFSIVFLLVSGIIFNNTIIVDIFAWTCISLLLLFMLFIIVFELIYTKKEVKK